MDIARRFLGEDALSPGVFAIGGRLGYVDDGETPNSLIVFHDYKKAPLIFEVRGLPATGEGKEMDKYRGTSVGVIVQYKNGHILCPDYDTAIAYDSAGKELRKFTKLGSVGHYANFLKAVRSRKTADLHGKILDGHISSALCHTGNIAYRLGKKAAPGDIAEKIKGSKDAADSFERLSAHLAANKLDLTTDQLTLGEFLKFDHVAEKFIGNPEADKLLTREYRAPFVVPEKV